LPRMMEVKKSFLSLGSVFLLGQVGQVGQPVFMRFSASQ
jgi:hypothetical protein